MVLSHNNKMKECQLIVNKKCNICNRDILITSMKKQDIGCNCDLCANKSTATDHDKFVETTNEIVINDAIFKFNLSEKDDVEDYLYLPDTLYLLKSSILYPSSPTDENLVNQEVSTEKHQEIFDPEIISDESINNFEGNNYALGHYHYLMTDKAVDANPLEFDKENQEFSSVKELAENNENLIDAAVQQKIEINTSLPSTETVIQERKSVEHIPQNVEVQNIQHLGSVEVSSVSTEKNDNKINKEQEDDPKNTDTEKGTILNDRSTITDEISLANISHHSLQEKEANVDMAKNNRADLIHVINAENAKNIYQDIDESVDYMTYIRLSRDEYLSAVDVQSEIPNEKSSLTRRISWHEDELRTYVNDLKLPETAEYNEPQSENSLKGNQKMSEDHQLINDLNTNAKTFNEVLESTTESLLDIDSVTPSIIFKKLETQASILETPSQAENIQNVTQKLNEFRNIENRNNQHH